RMSSASEPRPARTPVSVRPYGQSARPLSLAIRKAVPLAYSGSGHFPSACIQVALSVILYQIRQQRIQASWIPGASHRRRSVHELTPGLEKREQPSRVAAVASLVLPYAYWQLAS